MLNEKHLYQNLYIFLISWFSRISREFSRNFTSRSRSRGIFNSLFTLDLDFETFSFHFSLSISISRHFHFTFHSRNEWTRFSFHFSLLEMSEPDFHFTFHFLNFQYPLLQGTGPPPSNPKKGWIYKPSRLKSIPPVHFCQALNYVATSFPSFSNPTKSIWAHGRIRWAHFDPFSVVAPHTKTEMQVSKNCGLHFDESV